MCGAEKIKRTSLNVPFARSLLSRTAVIIVGIPRIMLLEEAALSAVIDCHFQNNITISSSRQS
jgi:hypothetical protein